MAAEAQGKTVSLDEDRTDSTPVNGGSSGPHSEDSTDEEKIGGGEEEGVEDGRTLEPAALASTLCFSSSPELNAALAAPAERRVS